MDMELIASLIAGVGTNIITITGCIVSVIRIVKSFKSEDKKQLQRERQSMVELKELMLEREKKYDELLKNLDREQKRRLGIREDD